MQLFYRYACAVSRFLIVTSYFYTIQRTIPKYMSTSAILVTLHGKNTRTRRDYVIGKVHAGRWQAVRVYLMMSHWKNTFRHEPSGGRLHRGGMFSSVFHCIVDPFLRRIFIPILGRCVDSVPLVVCIPCYRAIFRNCKSRSATVVKLVFLWRVDSTFKRINAGPTALRKFACEFLGLKFWCCFDSPSRL